MQTSDEPVVVEETYSATIDDLWKAITVPEQMREWFFFEMIEFEPMVGFETQFNVEADGKTYVHTWKLAEVESKKRIVYDWSYEGLPGRGLVEWDLESTADGTKLLLTNTIVESFPQDDPVFKRESCVAGWQYFINEQLKMYVEKT